MNPLRACSCGAVLEHYSHPIEPGSYVPCVNCALLYEATDDGLQVVELASVPAELAELVRALFTDHFHHLIAA